MAGPSQASAPTLDRLPTELFLHIVSYLDSCSVARLSTVSRRLRAICVDNVVWRDRCFDESAFRSALQRRRHFMASRLPTPSPPTTSSPLVTSFSPATSSPPSACSSASNDAQLTPMSTRQQRIQDLTNWDPVFPGERVSWYDEYIRRHANATVNWLQQPRIVGHDEGGDPLLVDWVDVHGVALYRQDVTRPGPALAVSPLADGSVCLWDVCGSRGRRGAIIGRSAADVLFSNMPSGHVSERSRRVDSGTAECISVSNQLGLAFVAVQSHLITIDLNRLDVVDHHPFPWTITGLSPADTSVPLTVGTSGGLHLFDYRSRLKLMWDGSERVDDGALAKPNNPYSIIFDKKPLPPVSEKQSRALTIANLPRPGCGSVLTDHFYVAGRFSGIAHFDRRVFPSMVDSVHSGAQLASLACLPYGFSPVDAELRRKGELTADQVERSKAGGDGCTLVAAGGYNNKGSLELYGIKHGGVTDDTSAVTMDGTQKNRQTAAASKLLSVTPHGTLLMCSDGMGNIKWFERDGATLARQVHIGHTEEPPHERSLFADMSGSDEIARRVISTTHGGLEPGGGGLEAHNNDDVLFWTGDRLGLVTFGGRRGFAPDDFEEAQGRGEVDPETAERTEQEAEYHDHMRRALTSHADEVRHVRNLNFGGM